MYEREIAEKQKQANIAQGYAGNALARGTLADAPRPAGLLKSHTMHLVEILNQVEGQRNRIYNLTGRLLSPRPQPGATDKKAERIHNDTLEGNLEQLIGQANALHASFTEIANILDSAL